MTIFPIQVWEPEHAPAPLQQYIDDDCSWVALVPLRFKGKVIDWLDSPAFGAKRTTVVELPGPAGAHGFLVLGYHS